MARSILVPLDGSHLAEAALSYALALARALNAGLALLHVVERHVSGKVHGDDHVGSAEEAERYLADVTRRLAESGAGVEVLHHVHVGPAEWVARSITEHRLETPYDFVALCIHGSGGPARALLGSVGQRVLAGASVPVLLVRPDPAAARGPVSAARLDPILVAFDAGHPASLPLASEIARSCAAPLHLLMVISTYATRRGRMGLIGRYLPGATQEVLDQETEAAEQYLEAQRRELAAAGLDVTVEIARGAPVAEILQAVEARRPGLTVMATHGHRGLGAVWTGSVASDVCARCSRPLLLVPVA